jgi:hypothetical protein
MFKQKLLPIHETLNVLLLAIFANQIFSLHIDFNESINYIIILKTLILFIGAVLYSITYTNLKKINNEAISDFYKSSLDSRNEQSIADRYEDSLKPCKRRYTSNGYITIACVVLFFLIEPISKVLCK